jgi:L-lactate dehydrogenase
VLGEHGDSEVLLWSDAKVGGVSLVDFARQVGCEVRSETRRRIDDGVRRAAYRIIEGRGATYYGIGAGLARIVRAVRSDERVVLTVSSRAVGIADFPEVCFSLPRIIGSAGVLATLLPKLSKEDHQALTDSVEVIGSAAEDAGF